VVDELSGELADTMAVVLSHLAAAELWTGTWTPPKPTCGKGMLWPCRLGWSTSGSTVSAHELLANLQSLGLEVVELRRLPGGGGHPGTTPPQRS
jgi:hypothetical protein